MTEQQNVAGLDASQAMQELKKLEASFKRSMAGISDSISQLEKNKTPATTINKLRTGVTQATRKIVSDFAETGAAVTRSYAASEAATRKIIVSGEQEVLKSNTKSANLRSEIQAKSRARLAEIRARENQDAQAALDVRQKILVQAEAKITATERAEAEKRRTQTAKELGTLNALRYKAAVARQQSDRNNDAQLDQIATKHAATMIELDKRRDDIAARDARLRQERADAEARRNAARDAANNAHAERRAKLEERRAAAFANHSMRAEKIMKYLSSASQGVMLGMSAAEGNVMGLAFGMIFLRWTVVPVALAFATLTTAVIAYSKFAKKAISDGTKLATSLESQAVQMRSWLRSDERMRSVIADADELSKAYGVARNASIEFMFQLEKLGMRSPTYIKAFMDAAAATGMAPAEIAKRFQEISLTAVTERRSMMQQLARDLDIPTKMYKNSLEMVQALEDRYSGSANDMATTRASAINRVRYAWETFALKVGELFNKLTAPLFQPIMAFLTALSKGFTDAKNAAVASGKFTEAMGNMNYIAQRLTPFMSKLGYVLGSTLVNALLNGTRMLKNLINWIINTWSRIKQITDTIWGWIQRIKELLDWIINWYHEHEKLVNWLLATWGAAKLVETVLGTLLGAINMLLGPLRLAIGLVQELVNVLGTVPKVVSTVVNAIVTGIGGIQQLLNLIKGLTDKVVNVVANLIDNIGSFFERLGEKLGPAVKTVTATAIDKASDVLDKIKNKLNDLKDKTFNVTLKMPSMPDMFAHGLMQGFGVALANLLISGVAAALVALAAAVISFGPVLLLVGIGIAALIIAGLIIAFPRETGYVIGFIAGWMVRLLTSVLPLLVQAIGLLIRIELAIIIAIIVTFVKVFVDLISTLVGGVIKLFSGMFKAILDIGIGLFTLDFPRMWRGFFDLFKIIFIGFPSLMLDLFLSPLKTIADEAKKLLGKILDMFGLNFGDILNFLKFGWGVDALGWLAHWVSEFVKGFLSGFGDVVRGKVVDNLKDTWKEIKHQLSEIKNLIWPWIQDLWSALSFNPFNRVIDYLLAVWAWVKRIFGKIKDFLVNLAQPWNWDMNLDVSGLPKYATGGVVPGPLGAPQLAVVHGGERYMGVASSGSAPSQGTTVVVNLNINDGVYTTDNALDELAENVVNRIMRTLNVNRSISRHRI